MRKSYRKPYVCSKCGLPGHNKRTCTWSPVVRIVPPKYETILTGKTEEVVNVVTGERTKVPSEFQDGDGWVNYMEMLYS